MQEQPGAARSSQEQPGAPRHQPQGVRWAARVSFFFCLFLVSRSTLPFGVQEHPGAPKSHKPQEAAGCSMGIFEFWDFFFQNTQAPGRGSKPLLALRPPSHLEKPQSG